MGNQSPPHASHRAHTLHTPTLPLPPVGSREARTLSPLHSSRIADRSSPREASGRSGEFLRGRSASLQFLREGRRRVEKSRRCYPILLTQRRCGEAHGEGARWRRVVGAGSGVDAVGGGCCCGDQVAVGEEGAPAPQAPQQAGRQEHRGGGRSGVRGVRNDCSFFCVFCRALPLPRWVGVQIQVSFQLDALGGDLFLGLLDLFPIFWFHTSVRFSGSEAVPPHYSTTKKATFVRFFWAFLAGSFSLSLWRIISKVLAFWR